MKKIIVAIALLFTLSFSGLALHAHAATTCLDTGCPDGQICKGSPPTCQANAATCNPACSGDTPICNQNADGTFQCISQAQYGDQTPGAQSTPSAPTQSTSFVPLAPIPGLTQNIPATSAGIASFLNNLYKFLVGIAAILAVIEIIIGGLEISTKDSVSKQSDGRHRITQAVLGLVLVLSPVLVFTIINPAILNLSLDSLKPLQTQWGTAPATNGSGPGGSVSQSQAPQNITAGQPIVQNGATVTKQFSATPQEAETFVSACESAGNKGYYSDGVLGNLIYDGQSCTVQNTTQTVSGSQVNSQTQCSQYAYTAFCSKVTTLSVVSRTQGALNNGDPSFSDPSQVFAYGDSAQFVNGCIKTDGGSISRDSTAQPVASCPTNILDLMKQNGMSPPASCYQFTAHCKVTQ
jgi:type IV secretory pathway VirB2 component (pilin)